MHTPCPVYQDTSRFAEQVRSEVGSAKNDKVVTKRRMWCGRERPRVTGAKPLVLDERKVVVNLAVVATDVLQVEVRGVGADTSVAVVTVIHSHPHLRLGLRGWKVRGHNSLMTRQRCNAPRA